MSRQPNREVSLFSAALELPASQRAAYLAEACADECASVGLGPSLSFAATFSDANWISMGGVPGADGAVREMVVDDSGNVYVAGDFTVIGGVAANRIAKWDGSIWSKLGSGISGPAGATCRWETFSRSRVGRFRLTWGRPSSIPGRS
jgi:hypothetical protein